jgi:hypothetical protein
MDGLGARGPVIIGGSAVVRFVAEPTAAGQRGIPSRGAIKVYEPWAPYSVPLNEFIRNNAKRTVEYYMESDEFSCPPKWLEGPEAEIPYLKSLKRFYPIVRQHVAKVLAHEDDQTVVKFMNTIDHASEVDGYRLNLKRFDPIDVITTILFNGIFIHSTDHYSSYEIFSKARYGVGTIRHPFSRSWFPGRRVPEDLLDDEDRIRWC